MRGEITYLIWTAHEHGPGAWSISLPMAAIKYSYLRDILLIRSAKFEGGNPAYPSQACASDEIHAVPTISRNVEVEELKGLKPPSFNSKVVCSYVLVTRKSGAPRILYQMIYGTVVPDSIQFQEENGRLKDAKISRSFINRMASTITKESAGK